MHDDDGGKLKPLAVGLILADGRNRTEVESLKVAIVAKAIQEGYALIGVYEASRENYHRTIEKLLASVYAARQQHDNTRVVFIPTREDLGIDERARCETIERIDENNLELVVIK